MGDRWPPTSSAAGCPTLSRRGLCGFGGLPHVSFVQIACGCRPAARYSSCCCYGTSTVPLAIRAALRRRKLQARGSRLRPWRKPPHPLPRGDAETQRCACKSRLHAPSRLRCAGHDTETPRGQNQAASRGDAFLMKTRPLSLALELLDAPAPGSLAVEVYRTTGEIETRSVKATRRARASCTVTLVDCVFR